MSITKQIAKNTLYLALGKALSTILGVLTIALLLRYLSPDDYGRYTTVLAFILLFGTFADFGLNLTATQDISIPNTDIGRTISSIFTLRLIITIALVLILPIMLLAFPYEAEVKHAILISSVLFFTYSLFQVLASYFQKTLQDGKVAFAQLELRGPAYYPIQVYKNLTTDPLSVITTAMGKMQAGEGGIFFISNSV